MKLVWSQPASSQGRPRSVLLMAVVLIFLGGVLGGRPGLPDSPRPLRAAVASLLATGGLLLVVGAAAFAFQKARRSAPPLSLARPFEPSKGVRFREEEQR